MEQFENLNATYLYCNKCGNSMPVKEKLLLILPDGCIYEYYCVSCGTVVGDKKTKSGPGERSF